MNQERKWVFLNSPFEMLNLAFRKLFPSIEYSAYFEQDVRDMEDGEKAYGLTHFAEDGEITILVEADLTINNAIEIFAHELAHAAVGIEHGHGEVWEKAFNDLFDEYNKIGEEMYLRSVETLETYSDCSPPTEEEQ